MIHRSLSVRAAGRVAVELGATVLTPDHLIVGACEQARWTRDGGPGHPRDSIHRALAEAVPTIEPVSPQPSSGVSPSPATHACVGFAAGLAAARGATTATPADVWVAVLWDGQLHPPRIGWMDAHGLAHIDLSDRDEGLPVDAGLLRQVMALERHAVRLPASQTTHEGLGRRLEEDETVWDWALDGPDPDEVLMHVAAPATWRWDGTEPVIEHRRGGW